jgi:hypothetical protein
MQPYILFVAEDGDRRKQWAIRVDYLLIWLAVGVLCFLSILAVPLLQSTVRQSERRVAPRHEINSHWTPRSGIDAGRTVLEGSLGRL